MQILAIIAQGLHFLFHGVSLLRDYVSRALPFNTN
jgi:hypothetical protein